MSSTELRSLHVTTHSGSGFMASGALAQLVHGNLGGTKKKVFLGKFYYKITLQ
jgi:hypothetical protein